MSVRKGSRPRGRAPPTTGEDAPMSTYAIRDETGASLFDLKGAFYQALRYSGYLIMIAPYLFIFGFAVLTLGLIEIRQANLIAFDDLIATLDQRDWYRGSYFDTLLSGIASDRAKYQSWANSLGCSDQVGGSPAGSNLSLQTVGTVVNAAAKRQSVPTKTCAEISGHLHDLSALQEAALLNEAKAEPSLAEWYDHYRAGIAKQYPKLIPVLGLMASDSSAVTLWARMPFELLEMLLLISMGALGGVISVTRCFVDPALPNPSMADLCYRPVAGGVIALGIYILFRASQLFFGGPSENPNTTLTTSIFVLAALGLASGFCAREAVAQIEFVATRILRRAEGGRDDDQIRNQSTH